MQLGLTIFCQPTHSFDKKCGDFVSNF